MRTNMTRPSHMGPGGVIVVKITNRLTISTADGRVFRSWSRLSRHLLSKRPSLCLRLMVFDSFFFVPLYYQ